MNVLFLDYDGVVNNPMWTQTNNIWHCSYNFPSKGQVNDIQAVQWVSEFCEKRGYHIVVTSTWRTHQDYAEMLTRAGLRPGIKILGRTPRLDSYRGDEIKAWLEANRGFHIKNFAIFDDDSDMGDLIEHLVLCTSSAGFREEDYQKAIKKHDEGCFRNDVA